MAAIPAVAPAPAAAASALSLAVVLQRIEGIATSIDDETRPATREDPGGPLANYFPIPLLTQLSARTSIRRAYIIGLAGVLLFLFLFLGFGAGFFSHLVGFLYPSYASFKAIRAHKEEQTKQWRVERRWGSTNWEMPRQPPRRRESG